MITNNLLVELCVEELPPKALKKLGEEFAQKMHSSLATQGLVASDAVYTAYATPRRLAVHIAQVLSCAEDKPLKQKLMPVNVGLDSDGAATPALLKKLAGFGLGAEAVQQLERDMDGKNEVLFINTKLPGATLSDGLQKAFSDCLPKLPIPKVMTYQLQDGWSSVNFVRPVHSVIALHGAEIVPVSVLGLNADRKTQGHRFESQSNPIIVEHADEYIQQLKKEGAVIPSFAERRAEIERQLNAKATAEGLGVIEDAALLDEVTALVERPNVLLAQFDQAFLEVPQECLILTMKANQKYFPLVHSCGKLSNRFLIVSNITPQDPSAVISGNERVVRPRLADAKFFFDQDRKKTLASRVPNLDKVVYHNKLGSQGERNLRVRKIARWVAEQIGTNPDLAERAALLSKADLLTDMVGEFPELQGIMGGYYARHDGEDEQVAQAIAEQYIVRLNTHDPNSNFVSLALFIADRVETLVGIWSIGLKPTGEKDPFALRRHALGIIDAFEVLGLSGKKVSLQLDTLLQFAASSFAGSSIESNILEDIRQFVYERCANQFTTSFSAQQIDAVLSLIPPLNEIPNRLAAVKRFATLAEAPSLASANKRVGNILKKVEGEISARVDTTLLKEEAEANLYEALRKIAPQAETSFAEGAYANSLKVLAGLKEPVDVFFEKVMVNAEDVALRNNRLALLKQLQDAMNRVADLSKLA